jgi:hypothetical protein
MEQEKFSLLMKDQRRNLFSLIALSLLSLLYLYKVHIHHGLSSASFSDVQIVTAPPDLDESDDSQYAARFATSSPQDEGNGASNATLGVGKPAIKEQ